MANTLADQAINAALAIANGGTNATTFTSSQLVRMNAGGTALESSGKVITDFADASHDHTGTTSPYFMIYTGDANAVRIKDNAGVVELRNSGDSAYVDLICQNLTVKGTTTTVESTTVNYYDTELIVNADYTGASPSENCAFVVERGTQTNAQLLWDEGNDVWKAGLSGSEANISLAGHTHVKANITDTPWSWSDVSKTGSSLADLETRAYSALTSPPADDNMHSLSAETSPASDDEVLIYDTSASAYRKMTRGNFLSGVGGNPGGSAAEVQYRVDATTFGGDTEFQYNGTTNVLTLTGTITPGASNNFVMKMGDAAGTNKISFTDSGDGEVASINSDGYITATGFYLSSRPDYTVTNNSGTDRAIDVDTCTIGEMADLLGNVIADLITAGIFQ